MTDLAVPLRPAMAMPPRPAFAEAYRSTVCPVHVYLGLWSDLLSVCIQMSTMKVCETKQQKSSADLDLCRPLP